MDRKWGRSVVETTRLYNKRSQLWLQNFNLDEDSGMELETGFLRDADASNLMNLDVIITGEIMSIQRAFGRRRVDCCDAYRDASYTGKCAV